MKPVRYILSRPLVFAVSILLGLMPSVGQARAPLTITANASGSRADRQEELQQLFKEAALSGRRVQLPAGTFRHSGILTADGVVITGVRDKTILEGTTRDKTALVLTGEGSEIANLTIIFHSTARSGAPESAALLVRDAKNFSIKNLHIDGSDSAGILVLNSSHGVIEGNEISNTLADSIHMTAASSDITVKDNTTHYSGDDGIAVVSYEGDGKPVSHISVFHNTILDNKHARGLAVVGGKNIVLLDNRIRCTQGYAGIYIGSEDSYHTFEASYVTVRDNSVEGCGGPKTGHGAIMVYRGYRDNDHIDVIGNSVTDSPGIGIRILGNGNRAVVIKDNTVLRAAEQAISSDQVTEPVAISGTKTQ